MMYKNKIVLMYVANQNFVFIHIGITIFKKTSYIDIFTYFKKQNMNWLCSFFTKIMY